MRRSCAVGGATANAVGLEEVLQPPTHDLVVVQHEDADGVARNGGGSHGESIQYRCWLHNVVAASRGRWSRLFRDQRSRDSAPNGAVRQGLAPLTIR